MNISEKITFLNKLHELKEKEFKEYYNLFFDYFSGKFIRVESQWGGVVSCDAFLDILFKIQDEYEKILERESLLIEDLEIGKISKTYQEFFRWKVKVIKDLSGSLKEEFHGSIQMWIKYFPEIDIPFIEEKIGQFGGLLDRVDEVSIELYELISERIHEDVEYYYFDVVEKALIRLNSIISYDLESFEFILNSNKNERYSINGYPKRIKFMETLLNSKGNLYIPYTVFIDSIGLSYNGRGHGKNEEGQLRQLKDDLMRDIRSRFRQIDIKFISVKKGFKLIG